MMVAGNEKKSRLPELMAMLPLERQLYTQLWEVADVDKAGFITGSEAVPFFAKSGLPSTTLGEIWELVDTDNKGVLAPNSFNFAVRLIAHAQNGKKLSSELFHTESPLPYFEGITPYKAGTSSLSFSRMFVNQNISNEDKLRHLSLFRALEPTNGLLDGEKAREAFLKSRLSVEKLSQIWNLADTQRRGSLDVYDFSIAMHYIQQLMDKKMVLLPEQLPGLIFGSHNSLLPSFPGSESPEPVIRPTIQAIRELLTTIDNIQHHQCARDENLRPSSYQNTGDSTHSNNSIEDNHCSISADEKIKFNLFFEKLDADGDGYIDGDVCFKFFSNSKLSQNILAQIWDLADITKSGSLSKEEFAIAMKLINNKNRYNVSPPANLPLSMVPPSLRKQVANIQPKSPQTIISNYSDEVRKASYRDQFKSPELFDLLDNIFIPRKTSDPQILNDQTNGHDIATLNNLRTIYNNQQQNHISLENKLNTEERAIQDLQTERARWETEYRHLKELNDMMEQRLNNLKTQKDLESKAIDNLKGSVTKMESELTLLRSALSMTMQELTITQSNKTSFLTALSKGQEESQELKVTFQKNRNEIAQLHQDLEAKIKLLGLEPRDVLGDMTVNTPINVNTWNNLTVRGPQLDTTGTSASSQTRSPQYREPEPVQKVRAPQDYGNSEVDSPLAQFQPWNILAHQESLNRG